LKLSHIIEEELFIAAEINKKIMNLPLHYFIFANLLQNKLVNMGKKLIKVQEPNIPGVPQIIAASSLIYGKIFKKSQILGKW
jgi:hypothetical protein